MAHFAELDENNIVIRVIVVSNDVLLDENGIEQEDIGAAFCEETFGGRWVQTSYNRSFRKNFAGTGYTYDPAIDAFIPPPPFSSWELNPSTAMWEAPGPPPSLPGMVWNDETQTWDVPETLFGGVCELPEDQSTGEVL